MPTPTPPVVHPRRTAARVAQRLLVPALAYLLMGLVLWTGSRFQIASADPIDAVNNTFVDAGIRRWGGPLAITAVNPFEGMGSLFMPLNPWITTHAAPINSVNNFADPFKPFVAHNPFSRLPFLWLAWYMLGAYLLARALRARPITAALCAQAAAVVALPPFNGVFFKGSYSYVMNPSLVIPVCLCLTLLAVFWRARPATPAAAAALAAAFAALGLATLWADPLFAALFLVTLLPFFAAAAAASLPETIAAWHRERSRAGLLRTPLVMKLGAVAAAAIALKLAGPVDFLEVIARYTAREHFPTEVHGEMQTADFAIFPLGNRGQMALGAALAVGCLAAVLLTRGRRRLLAAVALVHLGLLTAAGAAYLHEWFPWRYPLPNYLEIPSLPVYVVGAVCGFSALAARAGAGARRLAPAVARLRGARRTLRRLRPALVPAAALVALLAVIGSVPAIWKLLVAEPLAALAMPDHLAHHPSGFLERMRRELRPQPGEPFRGRMAPVVGVAGDGVVSVIRSMRKVPFNKWYWYDINEQLRFVAASDFSAAPWTTGIPTVAEYSHLISPPYYYFFSRLLNRRGDFQSRNLLWPTVANVDTLAAMGVRYLVTDSWVHHARARLAGISAIPGAPAVRMHLFAVEDPNLGTYSPTSVTVVRGGRGTVERLRAPDFDWRREVVLAEPAGSPLVPLERLEMRLLPNAIRIEASSPGRSLALLPVEFSRCWEPDDPAVRLVRANLAMTGLLFEGKISTTIRFRFGLFNPWRRLRDLRELRGLDLAPDGWVAYPDFISVLAIPGKRITRVPGGAFAG